MPLLGQLALDELGQLNRIWRGLDSSGEGYMRRSIVEWERPAAEVGRNGRTENGSAEASGGFQQGRALGPAHV